MIPGISRCRGFLAILLLFLSSGRVSSQDDSQPSAEQRLGQLMFAHSVEIEEVDKPFRDQLSELNKNYVNALNLLSGKIQKAGNLEGILNIQQEIKSVETTGAPGTAEFPEHEDYRKKYATAAKTIESNRNAAVNAVLNRQIPELEALKTALTKEGDLDGALRVARTIENLRSETTGGQLAPATQAPVAPASGDTVPPGLVQTPISDGPLRGGPPVVGIVNLEPGVYEIPDRIVVGDPKATGEIKGYITIAPGSTIKGTEILVDEGSITVKDSLFTRSTVQLDLGGSLEAEKCVFDRCKLAKGGAWTVKWFSARWTLTGCVLNQCFIDTSNPRFNGLKLVECTVVRTTLSPTVYYENPVEESEHEWRQVERCLFVDCEIPESTLLMMEDCVFENCRFVPDISNVSPEKRVSRKLYAREPLPEPPPGNDDVSFRVESADKIHKQVGSELPFVAKQ